MEPRELARSFAFGRIALGGLLVVFPGLVGRLWLGRRGANTEAKVLARALGARDVALGAGLMRSLRPGAKARGWIEAGVLADLTDFGATLAAGDDLPALGRVSVLAAAGSGVVLGGVLARSVDAEAG